ncbi:hypothetical protein JOD63_002032 [Microbacterium terrae]|uniref:Uncharacterized protein n=1 Tax=Microbacterium terrae TaxID=69369 RepID=A0A0M2H6D4_9MICO|nr:hypothetical protein [Microbacterium terrae]KJL39472.1 hypothetical protein RS81_01888 [Microbacterium terrae]MBP1078064.1 hypothetical protein [Microbacterium terrae]GLK00233.1 hypothetical protein GCM10017594_34300 [Microbacterium terrae]
MNTEQLIAIALPHSVAAEPHDGFHVSVFLSPKLLGDPGATLGDFPTLRDWASLVEGIGGIDLELVGRNGAIPVTRLDQAKPADWAALFPRDTPVAEAGRPDAPQSVPDWSGKSWGSYPAAETAGYAKSMLLATILADPVTPVPPRWHPLTRAVVEFFGRADAISYEDSEAPRPQPPVPPGRKALPEEREAYERAMVAWERANADAEQWYRAYRERIGFPTDNPQGIEIREGALTAYLDAQRANRTTRSTLAGLAGGAQPHTQVAAALSDLHEARRFYEEPDPDPGASRIVPQTEPLPLPQRAPEFHERVAAAGDHPALLRRLGLVIDVTADPAALRSTDWLVVRMRAQNAPDDLVRSPKVHVRALPDDTFVALPHPARAAEWQDGRLALGDSDQFAVLDVDPDGSALKTERFVVSLPRMLRVQANNDPIDAAAPALRATGLAVARTKQLAAVQEQFGRQGRFETDLAAVPDPAHAPGAYVHDVARGIRVEVFDAGTGRWRSLHRRLATVVLGLGDDARTAYHDLEEDGFLQGTTAQETPGAAKPTVKIHESVFGWDGWSLSVARPGNRIRPEVVRNHDDTAWTVDEHVEPPGDELPDEATHPLLALSRIAPGSLPRLRFGRRYAFRAWIVDLAGNVRPHPLDGQRGDIGRIRDLLTPRRVPAITAAEPSAVSLGLRTSAFQVAADRLTALRTTADSAVAGGRALRERIGAALADSAADVGASVEADALVATVPQSFLDALADASTAQRPADLAARVRAAAAHLDVEPAPRAPSDDVLDEISTLAATLLGTKTPTGPALRQALAGATPLRAFLRWDPVPPPAMVARSELTDAESLRVLVVRSGVSQAEPGGEVVVTPPDVYAAEAEAALRAADPAAPPGAPYFGAHADRHVAPPKTSQQQAELHGAFDGSLDGRPGRTSAAERAAIRTEELAWALRESGTLFDRRRSPLSPPTGPWLEQEGVRLVIPPSAEERAVADAAGRLPLPTTPPTDADPVVPAGQAPPSGSYVVHDTNRLELPYLPDPLATGVSLRFIDAGRGLRAEPPRAVHLTRADYPGSWPDRKPFLLRLSSGPVLDAEMAGRDIDIAVPAGDTQRFTIASTVDDEGLARMGVWDALDDAFTADPVVAEAARDGLLWALTPAEEVTLVHAVPRPAAAPSFGRVIPVRVPGQTRVALLGIAYVHGASTEQLSAEARWTDVADLGERGIVRTPVTDVAFTTRILPHETALVTGIAIPLGDLQGHAATQTFADTKRRRVEYVLRATTRYREYFPPALLAPAAGVGQWPSDDGRSTLSQSVVIDIPSSAPPPPPVVHSVVPLFRWDDAEEPEQPFARRRTRRSGVRVYLERGWFASGDGELLAVLLGTGATPGGDAIDDMPYVTQWGNDPAWDGAMVAMRRVQQVQLQNVAQILDTDREAEPGRPERVEYAVQVRPAADESGAAAPPPAQVATASYRPRFSVERGLWYVDIAFEHEATHWPFLRLAVARHQPNSLAGCHLSTPVRADFVQLPPQRVLTVGRPDAARVSVSLRGQFGHRRLDDRNRPLTETQPVDLRDAAVAVSNRVVAKLQERIPLVGGDLGWRTVGTVDLALGGHGATDTEALWLGTLGVPSTLPLRRPPAQGLDTGPHAVSDPEDVAPTEPLPVVDTGIVLEPPSDWRVRVEEWQHIPSDPPPGERDDDPRARNMWERRLVYADDVYL